MRESPIQQPANPETVSVVIDGTPLAFPPSGIRTYLEALVEHLAQPSFAVDLSVLAPSFPFSGKLPTRINRAWSDVLGPGSVRRQDAADVLHITHGSAPLRRTLPTVVTLHDLIPLTDPLYRQSRSMRFYQLAMSRSIPRCQAVIVPSRYVASEAMRLLGVDSERIHVIPMAADNGYHPARERHHLPDALHEVGVVGPYVFNVGGFDVRKNLPALLDAFAIFSRKQESPWQLVIAGAPHSDNHRIYPPVAPLIHRLGIADRVLLPGVIREDLKIALYQHASMYVTPSLNEGFGMTALEAMACGTPVIASNRTSLPEVVGDAGLTIEPNPETLAAAMASIATSPERAESMRKLGIERAAGFSWQETARKTAGVYRLALFA